MSRTSVVPLTQTSRQPVCHDCGWAGAPADVTRSHEQATRHRCDPAAVEAYRREQELPAAPAGTIERPALRYYGGKWRLAPWIIEHLPPHDSYIEPYAGAASVLLQKPPARIEVYNDLDGEVVNFFAVLRDHPRALIEALRLTPYSRAELVACQEPATDPVERARRLFVCSWQGRSRSSWLAGWRFQRSTFGRSWSPPRDFADVDRLYAIAERLRRVHIESTPALDVIRRFDTPRALIYCDPPYVTSTRSDRWQYNGYAHEMTDDDHRELAEVLHGIQGMAIVSGYESPLYDELFAGWTVLKRQARTDHRYTMELRTECLWLSPRAAAAALQRPLLEVVG